jgi:sugar/nucleoside kinase (ribokinase family)
MNAALAAARAGARCAVLGRVGSDAAAVAIRAELEWAGVEALLAVDDELATGTFVESGQGETKAISTDRGASARLSVDDIPRLEARAVLVSGHTLLRDDTAPAARAAIEPGAQLVAVVAAGPIGDDFHTRARGANVLFANEAEARALTGLDLRDAALALAELYELVVVTAGPAGAVAVSGRELVVARPSETMQSERSGAGDALAGVLLVALAAGTPVQAALEQACEAGRRTLVS